MKDAPPFSSYLHAGVLTMATLACCLSLASTLTKRRAQEKPRRHKIPRDLVTWRDFNISTLDAYNAIWGELLPVIQLCGLQLWTATPSHQRQPDGLSEADNYLYLNANKTDNTSLARAEHFLSYNGLSHAARSMNGRVRDYILRVVTAGGQGHDHLRIIRRLSSPPDALLSNNHILPIINEIIFEDIVIGVFPRLIHNLEEAAQPINKNSAEDVLYMAIQAFEALAYLHRNLIAHRDVFLNNFLVEWLPESLTERSSMTRPRVYIIDFETAVEFSENSLEEERRCSGTPFPEEWYNRPIAPELDGDKPYCPFRMDVWQLGNDLQTMYTTGLAEVDQLWADLVSPKPEDRPTASEAMHRLDDYLRNTPPSILHFRPPPPVITVDWIR